MTVDGNQSEIWSNGQAVNLLMEEMNKVLLNKNTRLVYSSGTTYQFWIEYHWGRMHCMASPNKLYTYAKLLMWCGCFAETNCSISYASCTICSVLPLGVPLGAVVRGFFTGHQARGHILNQVSLGLPAVEDLLDVNVC